MSEENEEFITCQFCGQVRLDGDCNCADAQKEIKTKDRICRANEKLDEIFCDDKAYSENVIALLRSASELCIRCHMSSITVQIGKANKAKISQARGALKIERHYNNKVSEEVEE